MTEEEKKARRKELQRQAYQRWYQGPKGREYLQKRKERHATEALKDEGKTPETV